MHSATHIVPGHVRRYCIWHSNASTANPKNGRTSRNIQRSRPQQSSQLEGCGRPDPQEPQNLGISTRPTCLAPTYPSRSPPHLQTKLRVQITRKVPKYVIYPSTYTKSTYMIPHLAGVCLLTRRATVAAPCHDTPTHSFVRGKASGSVVRQRKRKKREALEWSRDVGLSCYDKSGAISNTQRTVL